MAVFVDAVSALGLLSFFSPDLSPESFEEPLLSAESELEDGAPDDFLA